MLKFFGIVFYLFIFFYLFFWQGGEGKSPGSRASQGELNSIQFPLRQPSFWFDFWGFFPIHYYFINSFKVKTGPNFNFKQIILISCHHRNVWTRNQASSQLPRRGLPPHLLQRPKSLWGQFQARGPPVPRWYCPPRWAPQSHSSRTRTSSSRLPPG